MTTNFVAKAGITSMTPQEWQKHFVEMGIGPHGFSCAQRVVDVLLPIVESLEAQDIEAEEVVLFIEKVVRAIAYRDPVAATALYEKNRRNS